MADRYRIHPADAATFFDKRWRMQNFYRIRTKERGAIPFRFNPVQEDLAARHAARGFRGIREIDSKSRQHGVTTYYSIAYLDDTLFTPNTFSAILAHKDKDVKKLFKIVRFAYRSVPDTFALANGQVWHKPQASYDNVNELIFRWVNPETGEEAESSISVGLDVRSGTIHNLHVSEAAFIKDAEDRIQAGSFAAVPKRSMGSNISIESTSNGVGNWYEEEWNAAEDGETEFEAHFYGWYADPQNAVVPPRGWKPDEPEIRVRKLVWERYKVELSAAQLYWHEGARKKYRRKMPQEFPSTPEESFLTAGDMIFDGRLVNELVPVEPKLTKWGGKLKIWKTPKAGRRYVIAADPAEGVEGDHSVAEVIDAVTLEQVAEFRSNTTKPRRFGKYLAKLGRFYNGADIAPEMNVHGHSVVDAMRDEGYPTSLIYKQTILDETRKKKKKKLGWTTNHNNKGLIIDNFVEKFEDGLLGIKSGILKKEMLTFVEQDGKLGAKSGKHDDTIMAFAIALFVAAIPRRSFAWHNLTS